MFQPYYAFIGLRYSALKRKNHFISFISLTSMLGISLGVAVLITVLSVMNGFSKEIRSAMLGVVPHATLKSSSGLLFNYKPLLQELKEFPEIKGVAPFVLGQGLLSNSGRAQGVAIRGIQSDSIAGVYPIADQLIYGDFSKLESVSFAMVLGNNLAQALGVAVGDTVTAMIPVATVTPLGVTPRLKRFTVVGIYHSGTQFDHHHAFINLSDADKFFKMQGAIHGIQIGMFDETYAKKIAKDLNIKYYPNYLVRDWTYDFSDFFKAIKMEKTVMWCILLLIIAVAAFNLVSSLVMIVTDKRPDIAILRTIGASKQHIMRLFMFQGLFIGFIGTLLGLVLGLLLAYNITDLVSYVEKIFNYEFISEDVYFVGFVPSDIQQFDVIVVCLLALFMSFIATLYPAWKAASINPAEALRYE